MKNILISIIAVFMTLGCSSNEYEEAAWNVVKKFNNNTTELTSFLEYYKTNGDREKYEAACFIIANMPGKYSLIGENQICDLNVVKSDSLIYSLETSFDIRNSSPFLKQYSFSQFLEYILPYRIFNEPLEYYWKSDCLRHFHSDEKSDIIKAAKEINSQVKIKLSIENYGDDIQSYSEIMSSKYGKCDDRTSLLVMALRANGIPAAYEFVPCWGSSNNGHSFVSIVLPDDSICPLQNQDEISSENYVHRKTPKIYRHMYSGKRPLKEKYFSPDMFCHNDIMDVTCMHNIGKREVKANIIGHNNGYNYLSVFSPSGWIPVARAKSEKFENIGTGTLTFANENSIEAIGLGDGILYLPISYLNDGSVIPVGNPMIVSDCFVCEIEPDTTNKESVILTRKYPLSLRIVDFARLMRFGTFEAANEKDFSDAVEIYKIKEIPESRLQTIEVKLDKPYRYVRYKRPKGTFSIAELKLLDADKNKLPYVPMECDILMADKDIIKVFDNDPLTYYELKASNLDIWVGMDLKRATDFTFIEFAPRNDDNSVYPGDVYELFYWNHKWISLGIQKAKDFNIKYDNVPKNALLWLRNLTRGHEERPFTYDGGNQVWW